MSETSYQVGTAVGIAAFGGFTAASRQELPADLSGADTRLRLLTALSSCSYAADLYSLIKPPRTSSRGARK
jgi:hypothetical protein